MPATNNDVAYTALSQVNRNKEDLLNFVGNEIESDFSIMPQENAQSFIKAIKNKTVKVAFWGDSITQGADYVDNSATYVNLYTEKMKQSFSGVTFNVSNFGIASRKLEDAANQSYVSPTNFTMSWATTPGKSWREYVRDSEPDLLFIAFGMNGTSTTIESNKTNLDSILTFINTWSKKPTVILISNWTPRLGYVDQSEIDKRDAIARSTRAYAKLKGLGLIDVNRAYRILRYGKDDIIPIQKKMLSFDEGWQHDTGVTGDTSARTYGAAKYSKRNVPVSFKVKARFIFAATTVAGFKFRSTGIVFFNAGDSNVKVYKALGSANVIAQTALTITPGTHYLTLQLIDNKATIYFDDVEILTTNDVFFDFRESLLQVGYEVGTGTVDQLEVVESNSKDVTAIFTDDDIVGNYVSGDYSIKYPYGGNGVNHPTSIGLNQLYRKGIVQMIDQTKVLMGSSKGVAVANSSGADVTAVSETLNALLNSLRDAGLINKT